MPKRTQNFNSWRLSKLADPAIAASYLTAAMDDSQEMFRKALRNVAQARQMTRVARSAGVTRESLYRATSEIGNPTLYTLDSVLDALGIDIKFEAKGSISAPLKVVRRASGRRHKVTQLDPLKGKSLHLASGTGVGSLLQPTQGYPAMNWTAQIVIVPQPGWNGQNLMSANASGLSPHEFRVNAEQGWRVPFIPGATEPQNTIPSQP